MFADIDSRETLFMVYQVAYNSGLKTRAPHH